MKSQPSDPAGINAKGVSFRILAPLSLAGAAVFWIASFITSLLPLAADYRAAYSNWSAQTVWIGAVFMGLFIGACVASIYLRFHHLIPGKSPVLKAVLVSAAVLIAALLVFDLPMMLRSRQRELLYFLVGVMFNTVRFLLAGLAIGLLHRFLSQRSNQRTGTE